MMRGFNMMMHTDVQTDALSHGSMRPGTVDAPRGARLRHAPRSPADIAPAASRRSPPDPRPDIRADVRIR